MCEPEKFKHFGLTRTTPSAVAIGKSAKLDQIRDRTLPPVLLHRFIPDSIGRIPE
jgi:hypothetical protein